MSENVNATEQNQPNLNIDDIRNAIRVIDFSAEQGAFKGWQIIEQVLQVRNRLNDFVKAVMPPEDAEPQETKGDSE